MFIADTSIVSFCCKSNPVSSLYSTELNYGEKIFISIQTWEEMIFGALLSDWGEWRLAILREVLARFTVLPLTKETAEFCADTRSRASRLGRPLGTADAWIIATAAQYELTLLAHDRDMLVCHDLGIKLICRL
jgi:predicted nucleic acid-binding protein